MVQIRPTVPLTLSSLLRYLLIFFIARPIFEPSLLNFINNVTKMIATILLCNCAEVSFSQIQPRPARVAVVHEVQPPCRLSTSDTVTLIGVNKFTLVRPIYNAATACISIFQPLRLRDISSGISNHPQSTIPRPVRKLVFSADRASLQLGSFVSANCGSKTPSIFRT